MKYLMLIGFKPMFDRVWHEGGGTIQRLTWAKKDRELTFLEIEADNDDEAIKQGFRDYLRWNYGTDAVETVALPTIVALWRAEEVPHVRYAVDNLMAQLKREEEKRAQDKTEAAERAELARLRAKYRE